MKRANLSLILLLSCLCLSSSGCPASIRAVNSREAAMPPPPNMGESCSPMGASGVPTKESGFSRLEPGKECNATRRCDTPGGCTIEVSSAAVAPHTSLAFVLDAQGGVSGPSAAGSAPMPQIVEILLENSGFYGTGSGPAPELVSLTGRHWKRLYAVRNVGKDPPLRLTATVKLPFGSVLGDFGFRPY